MLVFDIVGLVGSADSITVLARSRAANLSLRAAALDVLTCYAAVRHGRPGPQTVVIRAEADAFTRVRSSPGRRKR